MIPHSLSRQETVVIGGGICGRLVALQLIRAGHQVTLFEARRFSERVGCSATAAGMLTPFAESVYGEGILAEFGMESLRLWRELGEFLCHDQKITFRGSLVLAPQPHLNELVEFRSRIHHKIKPFSPEMPATLFKEVYHKELWDLEPSMAEHFSQGIFFPEEGHVNTWAILDQLIVALEKAGVFLQDGTEVVDLQPHKIVFKDQDGFLQTQRCDMVFDCRGIRAQGDLPSLRGVRGESLILKIPQDEHRIQIKRPVRILHPRYPIYIVPRTSDTYVVGASMIECESEEPISVQTALELLTALYHCHESFKFASILGTMAAVRPAFPNNCPQIVQETGIIRANGLFRHGFLLAPIVAKTAVELYHGIPIDPVQRLLVKPSFKSKGTIYERALGPHTSCDQRQKTVS